MSNTGNNQAPPKRLSSQEMVAADAPAWAVELVRELRDVHASVEAGNALTLELKGNTDARLNSLETWRGDVNKQLSDLESTVKANTVQIATNTESDVKQTDALSRVESRVAAVEGKTDAQTEILKRIDDRAAAILRNPRVQLFLLALLMFLTGWLQRHTP